MHDLSLPLPPLLLVRAAVAAVWLYEGLWCKVLGRERRQVEVVAAAPMPLSLTPRQFLLGLGLVEIALAAWVLAGVAPGWCAVAQTLLLVVLNANGILWARHVIHDPAGLVVKNVSFLVLAWAHAAMSGGRS